MLEIKKDKIIADGLEKNYDRITVMNIARGYLFFSGGIADCVPYDKKLSDVYESLQNAGVKGFILQDDNIINLNNINSIDIEFYQYAGISIHKCSKEHAELYHLNIVCKNGKIETIPFRTYKEAENLQLALNNALTDLNNEQTNSI